MGRQAVFLSDEKLHDLEAYSHNSEDGQETKPSAQPYSMGTELKVAASPIRSFTKWALICILVVLAMTFTSELLEPQSSKAR